MPTLNKAEAYSFADNNPGLSRVQPGAALQGDGYVSLQTVTAGNLNWLLGTPGDNLAHILGILESRLTRGYVVSGFEVSEVASPILQGGNVAVSAGEIQQGDHYITESTAQVVSTPVAAGSSGGGWDAYCLLVDSTGAFSWVNVATGAADKRGALVLFLANYPTPAEGCPIGLLFVNDSDVTFNDEDIMDLRGGANRRVGHEDIQLYTQPQTILRRPRLYIGLTNQNNSDPARVLFTLDFRTKPNGEPYPREFWGDSFTIPMIVRLEQAGSGTESTAPFGSFTDPGNLTARIAHWTDLVGVTEECAVQLTENGVFVPDLQGNPGGMMHWFGNLQISAEPGEPSIFRFRIHRQSGRPAEDYLITIATGLGQQSPIRVSLPAVP